MKPIQLSFGLLTFLMMASPVSANIVGTDYQNFNPTTNGLDFVTVQSSETLKPGIFNLGLFFNEAANSLSYSRTLNANFPRGQKRQDRILAADLSVGLGLTERWDIGVNLPLILRQLIQDDHYVASFGGNGATEIKANTKYRFVGDDSQGVAAIFSFNQNLIEDNPFTGRDPGPTLNFELAADTTLANNWNVAMNGGYRKRNSGPAISNVPFVPMKDQWIYSAAASYLFTRFDTKLILEVFGSRAAESMEQDTDRGLNILEGLIGLKHDYSQNLAMHMGYTRQLDTSLGGPDWRIYAGLNWAVGPAWKGSEQSVLERDDSSPSEEIEIYKIDAELIFGFGAENFDDAQFSQLNPFSKEITDQDFQKISIEGHTDSIGPVELNERLSEKRALFVRDYLIKTFRIPGEKVEAKGFGSSQPLADNGNYQGRRKNRRVELKVYRRKNI